MSLPKISIEGVSIVLVGSFNPAIFQPAWFAAQGLISEVEADSAKIDVVNPELTVFSLDWLNVQVITERFMASTSQSPSKEILRDFVIGTFAILEHTPIRLLGLNMDRHFSMESEEAWHEIGKRLAPPGPWEEGLENPGMLSLTMMSPRTDDMEGAIRAKVEPSTKVQYGVFLNVNDHFKLSEPDKPTSTATTSVTIIRDRWEDFLKRSDEIASSILGRD